MNVLLTGFELIKHNSLDICQFQSDYALYMQNILEPLSKYHHRYTEMSFKNALMMCDTSQKLVSGHFSGQSTTKFQDFKF